ncbi:type III-B CRISPR-associated protein Cas10/Cmr2 [Thermodesulfovibrio sp. TK110]
MERSFLPNEKIYQKFNEVKHPLCEGKLNTSKSINENEIFNLIESVFSNLNVLEDDDKKKFFYLWRNLEDEILEPLKEEKYKDWIKYLSILPADTRIPDHSIWEHLKVTSAVNAFWDNKNKILHQSNSLFLFTIGPVQSFISQARKTQDFFMGSFMLSYLTFVAMKEIINDFGPTSIIYPDLYKQPLVDWFLKNELNITIKNSYSSYVDLPTIPNRFVAIISLTNEKELKETAEKMKDKIKNEIKQAKEQILKGLQINLSEKQKSLFENQLANFSEIYWVAVPWKLENKDITIDDLKDFFEENEIKKLQEICDFAQQNEKNPPNIGLLYQLLYTALEKSLGARKNLREFSCFEEKGRKCSLCGERNVLFFREEKNPQKFLRYNPEAINVKDIKNFPLKYLADGEGLCGLCFIKRTFEIYLKSLKGEMQEKFKDFGFPSTAEIAVSDFKENALENAKDEFKKYQEIMLEKEFPEGTPIPKVKAMLVKSLEGEWFFEENLRRDFIKKELGLDIDEKDLKEIKKRLEDITNKIGKPNPYYAIIHLDGDNMGKWLSGELLPEIEHAYNSETWDQLPDEFKNELNQKITKKFLTPAIHSAISKALRNYAIEFVRKIVEDEHLGKLVYAGGDDVLAFVNLKDLLDVMEKLRLAFSGHIKFENGNIKVDLKNDNGFVEKDGTYLLTMGKKATASMGIVIAHYKEPLKIVIDKVFKMEKLAKKDEKNRFAISLMKKSGEERISVFEWLYEDKLLTDIMKNIKEKMKESEEGYISDSFIQKFKIEFMKLKDEKDQKGHFSGSEGIAKTELKRLIERAYNGDNDKEKKVKVCNSFFDNAWALFTASGMNIDNFANMIEILSFMNKGD